VELLWRFTEFDRLISDYSGNIENLLNFDMKISKRVVRTSDTLIKYWRDLRLNNREKRFDCDKIIDVG
jgi:hypothetical protein